MVTLSGVASGYPLAGAAVDVLSTSRELIATTTSNSAGIFTVEVPETQVESGYLLETDGGTVGSSNFVGKLSAIYAASDDKSKANVTLVTTLVTELIELESAGTLLEKRSVVLQRLSGIGIFEPEEWNSEDIADVSYDALRGDVIDFGLDTVIESLTADMRINIEKIAE